MPRMRILSKMKQEQFEKPPVFGAQQRKAFLTFPKHLLEIAEKFRKTDYQIGFLLACGYFNSSKRFFSPKDYHQADIKAVFRYLNIEYKGFDATSYPPRTKQRHEHIILEFYGFKRFDNGAEVLISKEIATMVSAHPKPSLIFERCLDILVQNRIQLPSSRTLTDLIKTGLNQHKIKLSKLVEENLSDKARKLLDELFTQSVTASADEAQPINARYKLTLLKRISQSPKPTKIKERAHDFQLLKNLYQSFVPVMSKMKLTDDGIRYYAGSVLKSEIFQITRRSDEGRYLHAIAFIIHQYYRLQDNLVDVLLGAVQTSQNSAKREHKEQIYNQRKTQDIGFSSLLLRLDSDLDMLGKIRGLAHDGQLDDNQIVQKIRQVLADDKETELSKIKEELEISLKNEAYYDVLENRSVRLQNKASPILKALTFKALAGAFSLLETIDHFKDKNGNITQAAPLDFLEAKELKVIMDENDQKLRVSLYKSFLFIHVASAIKSGNLNLEQSYKYRPMDDYLIDRMRWKNDKDELLKRAELTQFTNPEKIFRELDKSLYQQYQTTNNNENLGNNPHLKIAASGSFRIATPALDDYDSQPLQPFFPKRHIVPLTEILATVNQYSGFLDEFEHWQQQHARKTVSPRTLYAGIMGLGCNIGTRKMAQISPLVKEDELENTINWRFSLDNLQEANDRILKAIDAMELPKHYQRTQDKLHTSSDGQKFEVRTDSLNANHSFKYFGKGQGVSVYTFIDERNLLWHSTVISAAERESAYVIDGLMHNDVVKSGIHSTDTHGYSEVIFCSHSFAGVLLCPAYQKLEETGYLYL